MIFTIKNGIFILLHIRKRIDENKGLINDFILVVETALSLHINHRESEDIDLFTEKGFLNKQKINSLIYQFFKDYALFINQENYLEFLINNINEEQSLKL